MDQIILISHAAHVAERIWVILQLLCLSLHRMQMLLRYGILLRQSPLQDISCQLPSQPSAPALTVYSWSSCLSGGRCCCCAMRPRNIFSCSLYASWFVFVPGASKLGAAAVMNCEQVANIVSTGSCHAKLCRADVQSGGTPVRICHCMRTMQKTMLNRMSSSRMSQHVLW